MAIAMVDGIKGRVISMAVNLGATKETGACEITGTGCKQRHTEVYGLSLYFGFNSPEDRAKRRKADLQAIGTTVTDFFWDVAPAHGFEMREGQQDMSCEIVDALIHNQHFAV